MAQLFLSYSHTDSNMAHCLAAGLEAQGHALWFDRGLRPGERWLQRLTRSARDCAALLVLMSPAAERSPWVEMELAIAFRYQRPILPLALAGHHFDALAHLQHVAFDGEVSQALLDSLPATSPQDSTVPGGALRHSLLSPEEHMICLEVAEGRSYHDIASALDVSARTVRRRVSNLRQRLLHGRAQ